MKSNRRFAAPLAAALLLGSAGAFAQPDLPANFELKELAPLDKATWRAIAVQNVRPSLLAYQLDPDHNKLPAFVNAPYAPPPKYAADYRAPEPTNGPLDLPDDMHLAGADERNLLFVAGGNAEQIARLQELVALLDQPLREVEIEAQMLQLSVADVGQFGIAFDAATPDAPTQFTPGTFQTGLVRGDFQTRLDELVEAGKARVISTKPQTITNNTGLAVSLLSGPIDNTGANQNKMPAAPASGSDTVVTLTPMINGDDTIMLTMNLATLPITGESSGLATIANLRDGATLAFTGLQPPTFPGATLNTKIPTLGDIPLIDSTKPQQVPLLNEIPIIGRLFRSKPIENDRVTLLFVTARIARAEEN